MSLAYQGGGGCERDSSPDLNPTLSSSMAELSEPAPDHSPQYYTSAPIQQQDQDANDNNTVLTPTTTADAVQTFMASCQEELRRRSLHKTIKKKKPHLKGRFSGRLETVEDQKRLPEECRALGGLLGGSEQRGENDCRTLAKIVRAIAKGQVRRYCEGREMRLRELERQIVQMQKGAAAPCMCGLREENAKLKLKVKQMDQLLAQFMTANQLTTECREVAYLQPSTSSISTSSTLALAPQMSATNIPAQLVSMTQVAASPPELQTHQCQQQQQARTMQIMQMQALATVYEQTSQQKLVNAVALEGQVEELKTEVTQKKDKLMQLESQIEEQHCSIAQQEADLITNKIQEINKLSHVAHKEHQEAKSLALAAQNNKHYVQQLVHQNSVVQPAQNTVNITSYHPQGQTNNPPPPVDNRPMMGGIGIGQQTMENQVAPLPINIPQGMLPLKSETTPVSAPQLLSPKHSQLDHHDMDLHLNDFVGDENVCSLGAIDELLGRSAI